jgi:hypothetical protein
MKKFTLADTEADVISGKNSRKRVMYVVCNAVMKIK